MTWPITGGADPYEGSCDEQGFHRLGAHLKMIDEKNKIFTRSCRRCLYTFVGQIIIEHHPNSKTKARVIRLNSIKEFDNASPTDNNEEVVC